MEEKEAIAQLKRGNPKGLEPLVKKYQLQAVRMANLIVRDPSLAEDIVQSAFIKAFESIHRFDPGRSFGPWFLKSVINDALKTAKRERQFETLDTEDEIDTSTILTDSDPGPEELLEAAQTRDALSEALAKLSPEQRAVIVMRYFLDQGEAEMSSRLNHPPGTIKWRLHKARENLRKILLRRL